MDTIGMGQDVPSNATTIVPEGLRPRFDGTKWNAMSREDFDKANPPVRQATSQGPTKDQKLLMNQQSDIVQLQKTVMTQQSNMASMQKLIMTQQAQITELKKGSN
ncbi:hypothetical protein FC35_GL001749 [Limosilactobacillus coleohominis DSM 14060]|nr:hypothetical protein FC35_GL001749 [Limosilactobacillus coleohominis DSM 14060]